MGLYEVLEIQKGATRVEIKKAYLTQAKKWHPDKNPDNVDEATAKFKTIDLAYRILFDEEKRARYDKGEIDDNGDKVDSPSTYNHSNGRSTYGQSSSRDDRGYNEGYNRHDKARSSRSSYQNSPFSSREPEDKSPREAYYFNQDGSRYQLTTKKEKGSIGPFMASADQAMKINDLIKYQQDKKKALDVVIDTLIIPEIDPSEGVLTVKDKDLAFLDSQFAVKEYINNSDPLSDSYPHQRVLERFIAAFDKSEVAQVYKTMYLLNETKDLLEKYKAFKKYEKNGIEYKDSSFDSHKFKARYHNLVGNAAKQVALNVMEEAITTYLQSNDHQSVRSFDNFKNAVENNKGKKYTDEQQKALKVILKGQGFATQLLSLQTDSEKKLKAMYEQKNEELLNTHNSFGKRT